MQKKKTLLIFGLVVLNLAIIWGNSMLPGSESSQISGGLRDFLIQLFPFLENALGEFLLRKLGHFSEFALLGFLLAQFFGLLEQKGIHAVTMPLLCGVLAALTDETIQVFSPGRGPSVVDVWIDTSGVVTGIIICLCIQILWSKRKEK